MAGLARIACESGHRVSGSDTSLYPPMSTQLEQAGVECHQGYAWSHLQPAPDYVLVGNVMSRGHPIIEELLEHSIPYTSGPQWLHDHVLNSRWVLAVAGTHGKTTTSAMLAHILLQSGQDPGYLIGGVVGNTGKSAQAGKSPYFVVEADEYDTAFFDKRSKFVHYRPRTLILNNLEYDHADIFPDIEAIQTQFHHLIRIVPADGRILCHAPDARLTEVLARGCWTPVETFGMAQDCDWRTHWQPGEDLVVEYAGQRYQAEGCQLLGAHNALNATAAVAAAHHAGVDPQDALTALASFAGVLRRLTLLKQREDGVCLYDDFAHHPTEIRASIEALKSHYPNQRILVVVESASNSMRLGVHQAALAEALMPASRRWVCVPQEVQWDTAQWAKSHDGIDLITDPAVCADQVTAEIKPGDILLVMSNAPATDLSGQLHARL